MASIVRKHPRLKEWALRGLLIFISFIVTLLLAEVIVRIFFPISDGRENVTLDGTPIKDWFEPGSVYRQVSNEYDAITTITDKGHRVPGVSGNPDVIFIGDSFTYGFGLTDEETFTSIYCQQLQRAGVNLGIPGSGTLRQVERLEQFIDKWEWKPGEVKLFFFGMSGSFLGGNDFFDNYDRYQREHSKKDSSQQTVTRNTQQNKPEVSIVERIIGLQEFILGHSVLMRLVKFYWGPMLKSLMVPEPGEERMAMALIATKEALNRLDDLSRKVGFEYTIYLIVPVQDIIRGTYGETLATLNQVSPKPAVETAHLFVDSPKRYYYAFDGHINVEGSRKIAEFLVSSDQ